MSSSFDKFAFGVFVGALFGAAYGVLTAPRPGHETRDIIRENMRERVNESVDTVKDRVDNVKTKVNDAASTVKTHVAEMADEFETTGRDVVSKLDLQPQ